MADKAELDKAAREAVDAGALMAMGWAGYSHAFKLGRHPPRAYSELRKSFYAGAVHLFTGMMAALDDTQDGYTKSDMDRMRSIELELLAFLNEVMDKQHAATH